MFKGDKYIIYICPQLISMTATALRNTIRDVYDFPNQGIVFKDITPVLEDAKLCSWITDEFVRQLADIKIDAIVGIESRGFLFGFLLAQKLSKPFILVRKPGKLPGKSVSWEYELEYGKSSIEMHEGSIRKGWRVLIHDDLLATGGTSSAAAELINLQHGTVAGFAFVVELDFLHGRKNLEKFSDKMISLIHY